MDTFIDDSQQGWITDRVRNLFPNRYDEIRKELRTKLLTTVRRDTFKHLYYLWKNGMANELADEIGKIIK